MICCCFLFFLGGGGGVYALFVLFPFWNICAPPPPPPKKKRGGWVRFKISWRSKHIKDSKAPLFIIVSLDLILEHQQSFLFPISGLMLHWNWANKWVSVSHSLSNNAGVSFTLSSPKNCQKGGLTAAEENGIFNGSVMGTDFRAVSKKI